MAIWWWGMAPLGMLTLSSGTIALMRKSVPKPSTLWAFEIKRHGRPVTDLRARSLQLMVLGTSLVALGVLGLARPGPSIVLFSLVVLGAVAATIAYRSLSGRAFGMRRQQPPQQPLQPYA